HTTIPVEAHSRARRSTTWLAAARPRPLPPTLVALTRPSRPDSPSALIAAAGKLPRSTSAALAAAIAATDSRADSYSDDMVAPGASGAPGPRSPAVRVRPGHAGSRSVSTTEHARTLAHARRRSMRDDGGIRVV